MFGYNKAVVEFALNVTVSSKDAIIATLNRQVRYLETELTRERRRAELAVDELLRAKGTHSVMPEKAHLSASPEALASAERMRKENDLLKNELEKIGDTGHHPDEPIDGRAPSTVEEFA